MNRFISLFCTLLILVQSTSYCYVKKQITVTKTAILPFSFVSDSEKLTEWIDISDYKNAKILDYSLDKGNVEIDCNEEELSLSFKNGEYTKGKQEIKKTGVLKLSNIIANNKSYKFTPNCEIKEILGVSGDFKTAFIDNKGDISLTISDKAKGVEGYDEDKITTSTISLNVSEDNKQDEVYTDYYDIPQKMPNAPKLQVKNIGIVGNAEAELQNNKIRVLFSKGSPKLNTTVKDNYYAYYWVDRAIDGSFRREYPNSIYRTIKKYFTGDGTYLTGENSGKGLIIKQEKENNWTDFMGFTLDGERYVYLLNDKSIGNTLDNYNILQNKSTTFIGRWFNTEKLKVTIDDTGVSYIPFGKLYSMGELVNNTKGYGILMPNNADESTASFLNPITGKQETYVKHYKFFYGPNKKETFGGYFTYPYKAQVSYEHYMPVKLYSGDISYSYIENEDTDGYVYNGFIKIQYTDNEIVNDFPPTAPYNITYNKTNNELKWSKSVDDYTQSEKIIYEIQIENDKEWLDIGDVTGGTIYNYIAGSLDNFRIRAVDEEGQESEWGYSGKSTIALEGEVKPAVIKQGGKIDINAVTKSVTDIKSVYASSEELGISEELIKEKEEIPNVTEVAFDLIGYDLIDAYMYADYLRIANLDTKGEIKIKSCVVDALTDKSTLKVNLPSPIEFTEEGTIIVPNQNYLDTPLEMTRIGGKLWYIKSNAILCFTNKLTGKQETFLYFENGENDFGQYPKADLRVSCYVRVNTLEYKDGKISYINIPVEDSIAREPIIFKWKANGEVTEIEIYLGEKFIYSYNMATERMKETIGGFSGYTMRKIMYERVKKVSGIDYKTNGKTYNWVKIVQAGDLLTELKWLGYKFKTRRVTVAEKEEYNSLPTTRNVYRLLFLDKAVTANAIDNYLSHVKQTNIMMTKDKESVFAKKAQEKIGEYNIRNISIKKDISPGLYMIDLIATDVNGIEQSIKLPLIIEKITEEIKDTEAKEPKNEDILIGRVIYDNKNKEVIEELSKTSKSDRGFICAGETLGIYLTVKGAKYLDIDIKGDSSIKTYDNLTKRFLEDEVKNRNGDFLDIQKNYNFPLTIYPIDSNKGTFLFTYTIPYKTKQNLESWSTLRKSQGTSDEIDTTKLFNRIFEAYEINFYIDGDKENKISINFDIFERWDTVLNRNVSKYLTNSGKKWRVSI